MSDVSLPPTDPDNQLVTRKMLRDELDKRFAEQDARLDAKLDQRFAVQDAKLDALKQDFVGQIKGSEESILSKVAMILEQQES